MTQPTPEQTDAYDAGRAAHDAGEESLTCPHPRGSELRLLWLRGWTQARRDAQLAALVKGE